MARRVEATNDIALESKEACVRVGYYVDVAATHMHQAIGRKPRRRTALVNLGYHLRVHGVTSVAAWFFQLPAVVASPLPPQLLSLGGGHDTLHWRLRGLCPSDPDRFGAMRTFDVDLPTVAASKARAITSTPELLKHCGKLVAADMPSSVVLARENYSVLAADITDVAEVASALAAVEFNFAAPTMVLSECVVAYLSPEQGDELIGWAAATLSGPSIFVDYSPVGADDGFGATMMSHFTEFGTRLTSVSQYNTPVDQEQRCVKHGWNSSVSTLLTTILHILPPAERLRLLSLEMFDELEEFYLTCHHYTITVAANNLEGEIDIFGNAPLAVPACGGGGLVHPSTFVATWHPAPCLHAIDHRLWNAAATTTPCSSVLYFGGYGGDNQARCVGAGIINTVSGTTSTVENPPTDITVGCTLSAIGATNDALLFGGRASPAKPNNGLFHFSMMTATWLKVEHAVNGIPPPSARWRHTAAVVELASKWLFLVYGGRDMHGHVNDTTAIALCSPDLSSVRWCEVEQTGESPGLRHSHCAAMHHGQMIVYGGVSPQAVLGGLFTASVTVKEDGASAQMQWTELIVVPPLPPRFGHSCSPFGEHHMCVVGGVGKVPLHWSEQILLIVSWLQSLELPVGCLCFALVQN